MLNMSPWDFESQQGWRSLPSLEEQKIAILNYLRAYSTDQGIWREGTPYDDNGLDPEPAKVWFSLGHVCALLDQPYDAVEAFEKALVTNSPSLKVRQDWVDYVELLILFVKGDLNGYRERYSHVLVNSNGQLLRALYVALIQGKTYKEFYGAPANLK